MQPATVRYRLMSCAICTMTLTTMASLTAVAQVASTASQSAPTTTPIKHAIIIIGENRSFDHVFAAYTSVNKGESVWNLLSEGIVKSDGTPGLNYSSAYQLRRSMPERRNSPNARSVITR